MHTRPQQSHTKLSERRGSQIRRELLTVPANRRVETDFQWLLVNVANHSAAQQNLPILIGNHVQKPCALMLKERSAGHRLGYPYLTLRLMADPRRRRRRTLGTARAGRSCLLVHIVVPKEIVPGVGAPEVPRRRHFKLIASLTARRARSLNAQCIPIIIVKRFRQRHFPRGCILSVEGSKLPPSSLVPSLLSA